MKNFMAFYGNCYYASGGMGDFVGSYDTLKEAKDAVEKAHLENRPETPLGEWDWFHIWSISENTIVDE